jgi:lipoprotein-anchoring transpeptidase ErfK/SrfK
MLARPAVRTIETGRAYFSVPPPNNTRKSGPVFETNLLRNILLATQAVGLGLRASSVVVIAFTLAGFDDRATAQSYPPPTPLDSPAVYPSKAADRSATALAALPPEKRPEDGLGSELPSRLRRQLVDYVTSEPAGTVIVDTPHTFLYLVRGYGKALRYGIGVGREGFTWSGSEHVSHMSKWPDWHPPKEMIERQPYLPRFMAGGESNPLGARALYLGNTIYRIHGTNQPSTIGSFVSSGCIRLTNSDIEDLYDRVNVGTRVLVLPGPAPATVQGPAAR